MIHNNWKKRLQKADIKQNALADALGMNRGEFSRVCQGNAVPPYETLKDAAAWLGCAVTDIYGAQELAVMYQTEPPAAKSRRASTVSVRILEELTGGLDALVEAGQYKSRNDAVNGILRAAL